MIDLLKYRKGLHIYTVPQGSCMGRALLDTVEKYIYDDAHNHNYRSRSKLATFLLNFILPVRDSNKAQKKPYWLNKSYDFLRCIDSDSSLVAREVRALKCSRMIYF